MLTLVRFRTMDDSLMKINFEDMMHRVNCRASDPDSLYHQAALKLGLSDSVLFVLYPVYENDGRCPLNDIRKATNISKQTLNSAMRKLEHEDIIYLEQNGGRAENVKENYYGYYNDQP